MYDVAGVLGLQHHLIERQRFNFCSPAEKGSEVGRAIPIQHRIEGGHKAAKLISVTLRRCSDKVSWYEGP